MFIPVKICGDKSAEANETLTFNLTNAVNATLVDGQGIGVITNDDVLELVREDSGPLGYSGSSDRRVTVRERSVPDRFGS